MGAMQATTGNAVWIAIACSLLVFDSKLEELVDDVEEEDMDIKSFTIGTN